LEADLYSCSDIDTLRRFEPRRGAIWFRFTERWNLALIGAKLVYNSSLRDFLAREGRGASAAAIICSGLFPAASGSRDRRRSRRGLAKTLGIDLVRTVLETIHVTG